MEAKVLNITLFVSLILGIIIVYFFVSIYCISLPKFEFISLFTIKEIMKTNYFSIVLYFLLIIHIVTCQLDFLSSLFSGGGMGLLSQGSQLVNTQGAAQGAASGLASGIGFAPDMDTTSKAI